MKSSILFSMNLVIMLLYNSCTPPPIEPPADITFQPSINSAPKVTLAKNINVAMPPDYVFLYASVIDSQNNIETYSWKQISGPSQITFSNADSLKTRLSNLVVGNYTFEFTATDKEGLTGKDTTNLLFSTLPTSTAEILFQNQAWECNFGCGIFIDISNTSFHAPFLIYIKRDGTSDWTLVPGLYQFSPTDLYYSFIQDYDYKKYLVILFNSIGEPSDSPDIKIVY